MFGLACAYAFVVFLLVSAALNAARKRSGGAEGSSSKPSSSGRGFFQALVGGGVPEVTLPPLPEVSRNATPPCRDMLRPAIVVLCFNR